MNTKLIEELREWKRKHFDSDRQYHGSKAFDEILSRHAEPKEEGLREFIVRLVERAKYLGQTRVDLPVRILEKSLEMYPTPTKEEPLEPKMGGMVCPKCSTIVKFPDEYQKKEEPLAVLADRKGWHLRGGHKNTKGFWQVDIGKGFEADGSPIDYECFPETTYAAAEAKARQYLEGLPDKADKGDK